MAETMYSIMIKRHLLIFDSVCYISVHTNRPAYGSGINSLYNIASHTKLNH